jgi:hypothetical protein
MNDNEIKKYQELRSKLWDEFNDVERQLEELSEQMETLDERHRVLSNLLTDAVEAETEETQPEPELTEASKKDVEDAILAYINRNPHSSLESIFGGIVMKAKAGAITRRDVSNALNRLSKRNQLVSVGRGRGAGWHFVDE